MTLFLINAHMCRKGVLSTGHSIVRKTLFDEQGQSAVVF